MHVKISNKTACLCLLIFFTLVTLPGTSSANALSPLDTTHYPKSGWRRYARILSFGVGFQNNDVERFNKLGSTEDYTISSASVTRPLYAKLEFYVSQHFGMAAAFNVNALSYDYAYSTTQNNQKIEAKAPVSYGIFTFNFRVNYHILHRKAIDVYIGGGSGLRIVGASSTASNVPDLFPSGFLKEHELTAGIRYLVKGIVGVYVEAGFSRSILQAGLSYNFKHW